MRIGFERGACRRACGGARLRLLRDVGQLVRDHVLAMLGVGLEGTWLEIDVAAAGERLRAAGHLRTVGVELDITEALAEHPLHAVERGRWKSPFSGARVERRLLG
jgi:hypothetical protein